MSWRLGDMGAPLRPCTFQGFVEQRQADASASAMIRAVGLIFDVLPSEVGMGDPVGDSMVSLARQRRHEAVASRRAPGDLAAAIALIEDAEGLG